MKNIYLLYGVEKQLIKKETNKILSKIDKNSIAKYNMRETNVVEAINDLLTTSLFNNKKAVVCENSYFLTGAKVKTEIDHNIEKLINFISKYNGENILILTSDYEKLDERKKIVKALKKESNVFEAKRIKDQNLTDEIQKVFKSKEYKITKKDASLLAERSGNNYSNALNEIDKLCLFKEEEKEITKEDIEKLVEKSLDENIFSLLENILQNNKSKIIEIYNDLILKKEEPLKILIMLANQFRLIYQTKLFIEKGYAERDIASVLAVHPYRVKLAANKSRTFNKEDLKKYMLELSNLDLKIKTGQIDKNLGLELFLLKL